MKDAPARRLQMTPPARGRRGFALVIVLILLALATLLVVSLLITVRNDRKTSKLDASGVGTHQLADAVVQVVIAQIQQATTQGVTVAWASQPGMIRTYDNTGAELTNYKLYSSDLMTTTGSLVVGGTPAGGSNNVNDYDPAWASYPGVYTDLNSPVTDDSGYVNFPILDGNNVVSLTKDAQGNTVPAYYGYDANGDGMPDVCGFSISQSQLPSTVSGQTTTNYNPSNPLSATNTPVPMPVKWLYQLKNGTFIAPDLPTTSTNIVTFTQTSTANQPSASNPIVARVAFWTDDESTKVNINTAGGDLWNPGTFSGVMTRSTPYSVPNPGAFWDSPRCSSFYEHDVLGGIQPAHDEYQRYPGTPSSVYLTAVFPDINSRTDLFSLTPRMGSAGSSMGGTQTPAGGITLTMPNGATSAAVNLNIARLYSSIDELQFQPTKNTAPPLRDTNSSVIAEGGSGMTAKNKLEQARFFITTDSRAPEVNLFGKPRVAIWPINSDVIPKENVGTLSPYGTAYDLLMAFCSHIGPLGNGNDYIFQRSDSTSFASSNVATSNDYYNISRNQSLYGYLESLTNSPIPGFGGPTTGFLSKYGSDRDQILTEIFDYIRMVNDSDSTLPAANQFTQSTPFLGPGTGQITPIKITSPQNVSTMGFGRFPTISEMGMMFVCCADGAAGTAASPNGSYAGSNATLLQESNSVSNQMLINAFTAAGQTPRTLNTNEKIIESAFIMNPYCVAQGQMGYTPSWQALVLGLVSSSGPTINGNPIFSTTVTLNKPGTGIPGSTYTVSFPSPGPYVQSNAIYTGTGNPPININGGPCYIIPYGGNLNYRHFLMGRYSALDSGVITNPDNGGAAPTGPPSANVSNAYYPFISAPFLVNDSSGTMNFSGGSNITIRLCYLNSSSPAAPSTSSLVQTLTVPLSQLSDPSLPIPNLVTSPVQSEPVETWWSLGVDGAFANPSSPNAAGSKGRMTLCTQDPGYTGTYIRGGDPGTRLDVTGNQVNWDVVRSLVPGYPSTSNTSGPGDDFRLIAALSSVPSSYWVPQRNSIPGSGYFIGQSFGNSCFNNQVPSGGDIGGRLIDAPGSFWTNPLAPAGCPTITAPPGFLADGTTGGLARPVLSPQLTGDFDNGLGWYQDGSYINKPDDGDNRNLSQTEQVGSGVSFPYFDNDWQAVPVPSYFSPNRMMPSPGMFGSLPTAVLRTAAGTAAGGWQTLLFHPGLLYNGGTTISHPNAGVPLGGPPYTALPDYLLMDLFWMPIVEPYAVSTPFSTAGKVNMNYQIAPFTYLNRSTAVLAALKAQKLTIIPQGTPSSPGTGYKVEYLFPTAQVTFRQDLNLSDNGGSLTEFANKFNSGDIFRSAAQICDIDLVPSQDSNGNLQSWTGTTFAIQQTAAKFWAVNALTGDNSRERPYANFYGLLTTKSDTYTVHFHVQTLQKTPNTPANQWIVGGDVITSDYRGSSVIERYIDPSDTTLPDFTLAANSSATLDTHYKFHVISTKKFAP